MPSLNLRNSDLGPQNARNFAACTCSHQARLSWKLASTPHQRAQRKFHNYITNTLDLDATNCITKEREALIQWAIMCCCRWVKPSPLFCCQHLDPHQPFAMRCPDCWAKCLQKLSPSLHLVGPAERLKQLRFQTTRKQKKELLEWSSSTSENPCTKNFHYLVRRPCCWTASP